MIKRKCCLTLVLLLTACASSPPVFDETFSSSEIAAMTSEYFNLDTRAAGLALKPTYAKYGAPHIFISGNMSAADDQSNRLHGVGQSAAKLEASESVYWLVTGEDLPAQSRVIKTAHLIYDKVKIESLEDVLSSVGSLSRRGQIFTVFEREADGQIVVTLHLTDDLPKNASLDTIQFSPL